MFVVGRPFQASIMFVGKVRSLPKSEGEAPALPTNIRLGWKGLQGTKVLAYYKH